MANPRIIPRIKDSTIAIALADNARMPIEILGSGVMVDPEGYFITAGHVIEDFQDRQKRIKDDKGIETWLSIFSYVIKDDGYHLIFNRIGNYGLLKAKLQLNIELDFDIAFGNLAEKENDHPFLEIETRLKHYTFDEIFMCGYPGGEITFHPNGTVLDMTHSPVLQYGRIASLLPGDDAPTSQGIITDIIGTGMSSGSPIIDAHTGMIIGIAQDVIGSKLIATAKYEDTLYTLDETKKTLVDTTAKKRTVVDGHAQVGLVMGVSNAIFGDIPKAIQQMKAGSQTITNLQYHSSTQIPLYTIEGSPNNK